MKLNKFYYIAPTSESENLGAGLILCADAPFYLGKIHRFKNDAESIHLLMNNPPLVYSNIIGYHIYITFAGSLTNNVRVHDKQWQESLQEIYDQMAAWYAREKISVKPGGFKRFKV